MVFGGFKLEDVVIATPHEDDIQVSEVLGMNILENFDFAINQSNSEIYLAKRAPFTSQKPRYQSGNVAVFERVTRLAG